MADDPTPDAPTDASDPTDQPDPEPQGDDTDWKAMARKHEREAKAARKEAERLRAANQTAEEKALEDAKAAGRSEAESEIGAALTTARVELAVLKSDSAKKLADPSDALAFLDSSELVKDGEVDAKALATAIDALLERKPHLAAGAPTPKVPQGARNGAESGGTDMNALIRQAAGHG